MSMKRNEIYKCDICGTMMSVLQAGSVPVCCGKKMECLEENSQDASTEKHVPVIEKTATGYTVTVGSVLHPMEEVHYIEFIQLLIGETVHTAFLKPNEAPVATFTIGNTTEPIIAREFCNLHGLWKSVL